MVLGLLIWEKLAWIGVDFWCFSLVSKEQLNKYCRNSKIQRIEVASLTTAYDFLKQVFPQIGMIDDNSNCFNHTKFEVYSEFCVLACDALFLETNEFCVVNPKCYMKFRDWFKGIELWLVALSLVIVSRWIVISQHLQWTLEEKTLLVSCAYCNVDTNDYRLFIIVLVSIAHILNLVIFSQIGRRYAQYYQEREKLEHRF